MYITELANIKFKCCFNLLFLVVYSKELMLYLELLEQLGVSWIIVELSQTNSSFNKHELKIIHICNKYLKKQAIAEECFFIKF